MNALGYCFSRLARCVVLLFFFFGITSFCFGQNIQLQIDDLFHCEPNDSLCGAIVDIYPNITNNCSEFEVEWAIDFDSDNVIDSSGTGPLMGLIKYGDHRIVWAVEDTCGMDWSVQSLDLNDCTDPVITCDTSTLQIYVGAMCFAQINSNSFVGQAIENCPDFDLSFSQDPDDTLITYDITDLGVNSHELWIVDQTGNRDSCSFSTEVIDTGMFCLPGVSLQNCTDQFICNSGESDCSSFISFAPVLVDTCQGLSVIYTIDLDSDSTVDLQGSDSIFRQVPYGVHQVVFIATDSCGTDTCTLQLEILDCTNPVAQCPPDTLQVQLDSNCSANLLAVLYDTAFDDNCDSVHLSFSSDVSDTLRTFDFFDIGFQSIELFGTDPFFNQSSCTVTIEIVDTGSCPVLNLASCDDISIVDTAGTECGVFLDLLPVYDDSCSEVSISYSIDFDRDSVIDSIGNGGVSALWPYGTHEIIWIVEDDCFADTCVQYIELVDSVLPSITCIQGILTVPLDSNYEEVLQASLLESGSSDNCSLEFYFDSDLETQEIVVGCEFADLGELTIHGVDESGNQDSCVISIMTQATDSNECETPIIYGVVQKPLSEEKENVMMTLDKMLQGIDTGFTDVNGEYLFDNKFGDPMVALSADLQDDPMTDVTTFDIVKIQKHLLQLEEFPTFFHYVAADVNRSCSVSALDMVEIRKVLLGSEEEFLDGQEWIIFNQAHDTSDFDALCDLPEIVEFTWDSSELVNWWAVKVGDVSSAVVDSLFDQNNETRSLNTIHLEKSLSEMTTTVFELTSASILDQDGFQFSLSLPHARHIESITSEVSNLFYNVVENELRVIWYRSDFNNSWNEHFKLTIHYNEMIEEYPTLTNSLTPETYEGNFKFPIVFDQTKEAKVQMYPNPVAQDENIQFNGGNIQSIRILDPNGRQLYSQLGGSSISVASMSLLPGRYSVYVLHMDGSTEIQHLIVQ